MDAEGGQPTQLPESRGLGVRWKATPEELAEWAALLTEDADKRKSPLERSARRPDADVRDDADGISQ